MITYREIFENNKVWIQKKLSSDPEYFKHLSEGQSPAFLYIGCSDSRVTAEELMGVKPGEVFVHRNVGNVISNTDLNAMSVIEYAVAYLEVKHIVVCGHYGCGGVKSAMQAKDLGLLNGWLRNIRDVYRLHSKELNAIENEDDRYNRLVELNVIEQCINIIKTAVLQKHYLQEGFPTVHAWVFDISTGKLIDLELDFDKTLEVIREIYDLGKEI